MVAGIPWQGGATWAVLQYALGARQLGCEVYLLEEVQGVSAPTNLIDNQQLRYFRQVCHEFDFDGSAALRFAHTHDTAGMSHEDMRKIAEKADILINVAGTWPLTDGFDKIPVRIYLDLDPGFTQVWDSQGID